MGKIRIAEFESLAPAEPETGIGMVSGGISTQAIFAGDGDHIHARLHTLAPGAALHWSGSRQGHLIFVWSGQVAVSGTTLAPGSMIVVEHGGAAEATANGNAHLLVFNRRETADAPARCGGHVHVLPADRVPRTDRLNETSNYGAAIFADSGYPSCELWLHESRFFDPDLLVAPHYHSEDEVIVVTGGQIVLGTRRYGRGTAIAVPKNTVYSFHTGAAGLDFINFRPSRPTYATPDGARVMDEQALYERKLGRPVYLELQ